MSTVHIVATGVANTASVCAAFDRIGVEPEMVETAADILDASFVVLPGVGAFGAAVTRLRSQDWTDPLRRRVQERRPTLAICLGLQLLGSGSAETAEESGLRCVDANAGRFPDDVRVPHMGWNRVDPEPGCRVLEPGVAYFAHSYRWPTAPADWHAAMSDHGDRFVAAVESDAVVACQFHPELSGDYGAALLRRWLRAGGASC